MTPEKQRAHETKVEDVLDLLRSDGVRLVSIFGSLDEDGQRRVHYVVDVDSREYRVLDCAVEGSIRSATAVTPAAAWYERELADQFGVEIHGHPDLRPLLLHENWPDGVHPMTDEVVKVPTAHRDYRFLRVQGEGVCEVPVGPVHAGIIEPGHFRFSVVGDTVLHLELRHFYTHKGTEKLFKGAPILSGPLLAESVSGDHCFAHAVAYCQAVENAFGVAVPPRGRAIRLVGLELERMVAHIADLGALCGDVGFTVPAAYTARIKESLLQASVRSVGTRFWRGIAISGGVKRDLLEREARQLSATVAEAARDFAALARMVLDTPSVQDRFETTGVLTREASRALAVVGPAARASGVRMDVRVDHPYGLYRTISTNVPHYRYGDVLARARMRIDETAVSARLIDETLSGLPAGAISTSVPPEQSAEGFSAVESPRGELLYWVRVRDGVVARCHIKSPSFQNWPALPLAMPGNIIADFPLINKSFNLSYSGCDR
ncbi:MAG: NADH-quinone oxidoreductase subunit C [Acidobacteriia bacterium]|nr:NADH-quinone oxidoreductase subunit C [Terriglobia bacterium]